MDNDLWAWAIIGAAAGLAGMMYPFKRGISGVIINIVLGVAGAVVFGLVSEWMAHGPLHQKHFWGMLFAAIGALATVVLAHAAYSRLLSHKRVHPPRPARP